jgi:hypothetical protein
MGRMGLTDTQRHATSRFSVRGRWMIRLVEAGYRSQTGQIRYGANGYPVIVNTVLTGHALPRHYGRLFPGYPRHPPIDEFDSSHKSAQPTHAHPCQGTRCR